MATDDEYNNDSQDDLSSLLKKYFKPKEEIDPDKIWENVSKKIDSLFHKEVFSDRLLKQEGIRFSEEERYWLGLEEYIGNKVNSLKHKMISEHLLQCSECRQNYNQVLDKKKAVINV